MPPIVGLVISAIAAVVVFLIVRWLLPLLFGLLSVPLPPEVVNGIALLVALGVFVYGWRHPWV